MVDASSDALRAALRAIKDPASGRDIVTAGLVEAIEVRGGLVQVTLLTDRAHAAAMEPVRAGGRGGADASARGDQRHRDPDRPQGAGGPAPAAPAARSSATGRAPAGAAAEAGAAAAGGEGDRRRRVGQGRRRQVDGGGEPGGGAGSAGPQVGLLDADIYGPSLPRMLGMTASRRCEMTR